MTRTSHALVPVDSRPADCAAAPARPLSSFVAHLIATASHAPQTRDRRRAEPDIARAAYAGRKLTVVAGRTLNRGA